MGGSRSCPPSGGWTSEVNLLRDTVVPGTTVPCGYSFVLVRSFGVGFLFRAFPSESIPRPSLLIRDSQSPLFRVSGMWLRRIFLPVRVSWARFSNILR